MIQPVILCGGSGTRLWPLSREHYPKQLHALNGEGTQLRRSGARAKAILLEPIGRGTAPALTLAAVHALSADDPVLLAMPSDHFITQREAFQRAVQRGAALY